MSGNVLRFFSMKIKMMDLWMQIEGTKLIFVINISVVDFFKFASRMPHIAQILVSTFKIFRGGACPRTPLEMSSFFSLSNSRLWVYFCVHVWLIVWFCGAFQDMYKTSKKKNTNVWVPWCSRRVHHKQMGIMDAMLLVSCKQMGTAHLQRNQQQHSCVVSVNYSKLLQTVVKY